MSKIFLIRHAHAGDRRSHEGDDGLRPLSDKGLTQAKNLAKVLRDQGVGAVFSSPATRCVQTVEPLAARLGQRVDERRELREGADPAKLIRLMEELATSNPAMCGHGDVIPQVVQLLERRGMSIDGPAGNNKASWWVLEHDGGAFTRARWNPPT
jgi:phosphohistidine phosphatase SixA